MSARICLVNPPFFDTHRPSIGLGILKAILNRAGFDATIHYANMWYAEALGIDDYVNLSNTRPEDALGDWVFGAAAFPEFSPDHDEYLTALVKARPYIAFGRTEWREWLKERRAKAVAFVDDIVERLLGEKPRIVGCTSTFCQHAAALAILRRIRERDPTIITMMGGANCESSMGKTTHRNFEWVDFVVSGEAEDIIVPLCRGAIEHGRELPMKAVPYGVLAPVHRARAYPQGKLGDGVPRALAIDVNSIPPPDYSEYFAEVEKSTYRKRLIPNLLIETSRGCWWGQISHCTFCGLNGHGMSYRSKSPDKVMQELEHLVGTYKVRKVEAVDNILDMRYFETVLPRLAEFKPSLSLFFETKSNLTRQHLEILSKSGTRAIQPGIESLDTRVLKLMQKGVSAWQNVRLLKWARKYGFIVSWNTIIGFPGEEDSWYGEVSNLIPKLFHLQPGSVQELRFDRFSPYHNNPETYGLKLEPYATYKYALPLGDADLKNQVYFFQDRSQTRPTASLVPGARPGVDQYVEVCRQWSEKWRFGPRPICILYERDRGSYIRDTRPAYFNGKDRELSATAVAILDVAEDCVPIADLVQRTLDACPSLRGDIENELADLVSAGLVALIDKRALTLAIRPPVRQQFAWFESPLGMVGQRVDPVVSAE